MTGSRVLSALERELETAWTKADKYYIVSRPPAESVPNEFLGFA